MVHCGVCRGMLAHFQAKPRGFAMGGAIDWRGTLPEDVVVM